MINYFLDILLADPLLDLVEDTFNDCAYSINCYTPEGAGIVGYISEDTFIMFDVRVQRGKDGGWEVVPCATWPNMLVVKDKYFGWLSQFDAAYPIGFGINPIPTEEQVNWHLAMNGLSPFTDSGLKDHDKRHMAFGIGFSDHEEEFLSAIEMFTNSEFSQSKVSTSSIAVWAKEFKKDNPQWCELLGL